MSQPDPIMARTAEAQAFESCESLAELIRMAVADARSVGRDSHYPNHGYWHHAEHTEDESRCLICNAGAVMANRYRIDPREIADIEDFGQPGRARLIALDATRSGNLANAYSALDQSERAAHRDLVDLAWSETGQDVVDTSHFYGWEAFDLHLTALERLAGALEGFESRHPAEIH